MGTAFNYYINFDERGEFFADVRDKNEHSIFEIRGTDIFEDGYMTDKHDVSGLRDYLVELAIIEKTDTITL